MFNEPRQFKTLLIPLLFAHLWRGSQAATGFFVDNQMPRPKPSVSKVCPHCKEDKPLDNFYCGKSYDGGYSSYCKPCCSVMNKENKKRNPHLAERQKARLREKYKADPAKYKRQGRLAKIKQQKEKPAWFRAMIFFDGSRKHIAGDVTREYLEQLFLSVRNCQCCGKTLKLEYDPDSGRRCNDDSPSIDRVNNDRGYTRANIAVICWKCNYRKTDLSLGELDRMVTYVKRHGEFDEFDD